MHYHKTLLKCGRCTKEQEYFALCGSSANEAKCIWCKNIGLEILKVDKEKQYPHKLN